MYAEASGFDSLDAGGVHGDGMREIAQILKAPGWESNPGTFVQITVDGAHLQGGNATAQEASIWNIAASRVVPVANAVRPRAWGSLACCYLGQLAS